MKKITIIIISLMCVLSVVSACGNGETNQNAQVAAEETVSITEAVVTETEESTTVEEITEETTREETTEEDTSEQESESETEKEYPEYPEEDGWVVKDGVAIRIGQYYFNEETPELLLEGEIDVADEDDSFAPIERITIQVYQDGIELRHLRGADISTELTYTSYMPLEEVYETISDSDNISTVVTFKRIGETKIWK